MASQPPPAKRVRTGCLKCRVRRRKCDEGKPRCQRCIAGGYECQYGTKLSFLQKNAFTVDAAQVSTSAQTPTVKGTAQVSAAAAVVPTPNYRKVQFVDELPNPPTTTSSSLRHASASADESQPSHHHRERRPSQSTSSSSLSNQAPPTPTPLPLSELPGIEWKLPPLKEVVQQATSPSSVLSPRIRSPPVRDQVALDALLSLGHEHASVFIDQNARRRSSTGTRPKVEAEKEVRESVVQHSASSIVTPPERTLDVVRSSAKTDLPEEVVFDLLKHWRYEVAPWLDICDLSQTFGISVSCLAIESTAILLAILAISTISRKVSPKAKNMDLAQHASPTEHMGTSDPTNVQDTFISESLARAQRVFGALGQDNEGLRPDHLMTLTDEMLVPGLALPAVVASFYLNLRLDVSYALMNEIPLSTARQILESITSPWQQSELARTVLEYAQKPLLSCIHAINFCYGDRSDFLGPHEDIASAWRNLVDDLGAWYSRRPDEFKSMVELDNAEAGFPTILFTSGAAVFGNQLYHTAMFLLLGHKPRTVMLAHRHRSSNMSALWHARRICGIALNNDRRECWDMSLVASLVVASRTMTHEAQHQAILEAIERISRLTGWDIGGLAEGLKAEWGQ